MDWSEGVAYNAVIASIRKEGTMATITIRNLYEKTKARLRVRAAQNGRSMEEEARTLLRIALRSESIAKGNLAQAIRARFRRLGGVALRLPARDPMREPPKPGR